MDVRRTGSRLHVTGASVRGASHRRSGTTNQDALGWLSSSGSGDRIVVAIANGHGSHKSFRSQIGAQLAVEVATTVLWARVAGLSLNPNSGSDLPFHESLHELTACWNTAVADHCDRQPFDEEELSRLEERGGSTALRALRDNPLIAYGATLLAVVVSGTAVHYAQLGDGTSWPSGPLDKYTARCQPTRGSLPMKRLTVRPASRAALQGPDRRAGGRSPPDPAVDRWVLQLVRKRRRVPEGGARPPADGRAGGPRRGRRPSRGVAGRDHRTWSRRRRDAGVGDAPTNARQRQARSSTSAGPSDGARTARAQACSHPSFPHGPASPGSPPRVGWPRHPCPSLAFVLFSQPIERDQAARSRQLASSAGEQLSSNPELGLLLAIEAYDLQPTQEAETVLRQATLGVGCLPHCPAARVSCATPPSA